MAPAKQKAPGAKEEAGAMGYEERAAIFKETLRERAPVISKAMGSAVARDPATTKKIDVPEELADKRVDELRALFDANLASIIESNKGEFLRALEEEAGHRGRAEFLAERLLDFDLVVQPFFDPETGEKSKTRFSDASTTQLLNALLCKARIFDGKTLEEFTAGYFGPIAEGRKTRFYFVSPDDFDALSARSYDAAVGRGEKLSKTREGYVLSKRYGSMLVEKFIGEDSPIVIVNGHRADYYDSAGPVIVSAVHEFGHTLIDVYTGNPVIADSPLANVAAEGLAEDVRRVMLEKLEEKCPALPARVYSQLVEAGVKDEMFVQGRAFIKVLRIGFGEERYRKEILPGLVSAIQKGDAAFLELVEKLERELPAAAAAQLKAAEQIPSRWAERALGKMFEQGYYACVQDISASMVNIPDMRREPYRVIGTQGIGHVDVKKKPSPG